MSPDRGRLALWLYGTSVVQLVVLAVAVVSVGMIVGGPPHDHDHERSPQHADHGAAPDGPGHPPGPPPGAHQGRPGLLAPLATFFGFGLVIVAIGAGVTAKRVQRMLMAEKELLANVSHELRTPLARIRVALDLASEGDAEAARSSLAEIAVDLGELEVLLDDVLTSTRLEIAGTGNGSGLPMHPEEVDPAELAARAAERFRGAHPKRPLVMAVDPDLPVVVADPMLLRRVLDNLLENAHKYTPDPSSAITLTAAMGANKVIWTVEDRGSGISPSDLENVFVPFSGQNVAVRAAPAGLGWGSHWPSASSTPTTAPSSSPACRARERSRASPYRRRRAPPREGETIRNT